MKLRLVLSALAACLLAVAAGGTAHADVVFGNLGTSGTGGLGGTNTDVGPGVNDYIAQGFTAASPNLAVTSVSLGLFGATEGTVPATIAIYANNFGQPAASPLYTSNTVNIGSKATYTFSFSGANLTNGSTYWVIPQSDMSWYLNNPGSAPVEQNSSGYTFVNTLENIGGSGWSTAGSNRYSISIVAVPVPEPSTYALAAAGLAIAGFMRARRRKSDA